MGAALGRAVGKTFLGRGLVKAGSRGSKGLRAPRMSIGAMRWAGTGSYRAMVEGAGESSASAVGRGAGSAAGRSMTVPRLTAAGRAAATAERDAEGFVEIPLRTMGESAASTTAQTARVAAGRAGQRLAATAMRGRLIGGGTAAAVGAGGTAAGFMSTSRDRERNFATRPLPSSSQPQPRCRGPECEAREEPQPDPTKPERRPPPTKDRPPAPTPGRPGSVPPKAGRNPGKYVPPSQKPPTQGTPSQGKPTQGPPAQGPKVQPIPKRVPTYGEIRGSFLAPSGALLRGRGRPQRGRLPRPGGVTYDQIRGALFGQRSSNPRLQRGNLTNMPARGTIGGSQEFQRALLAAQFAKNKNIRP